jgi:hypothetical protein
MTMATINVTRIFPKAAKRPVALIALGALLAVFIGSALVERMEKHAAEDRLSFGTMADTCVRASCSPSHIPLD